MSRSHRAAATIAVLTFVVLVLELTSTRLFAYIGSAHATSTALSVALLGLGAGAVVRLRWPGVLAWADPALSASLLVLAGSAIAAAPLGLLVVVSLAPFALAGVAISEAYAARGSASARQTYAIDLCAAAAGCLVAPHLLGPLAPTEIMLLLGVASCGLIERRSLAAVLVLAHLALFVASRAGALPDGPLVALLANDRHSEKAIVEAGASRGDIIDSAWSPLGRLDVRRVPGDPSRLGVFTDGMSPTYLVAKDAAFEDSWGLLMSLPYRALRPARVLVLGAGAGASVLLAKQYGATRVDAVEVNPAIPGVLARAQPFAGDVYGAPGVHLTIADARRYLTDTQAQYDLIELALALTGNVHAQPAGMEAHLFTVEAVELYLRRLAPAGTLVLIHSDPGNAYRQLLTVLEALAARGIPRERALEGIAVLRDPRPGTAYRYLLVVRTSPLPLEVVDGLDVPPAELLWGPGDPPARRAELLDPTQLGATDADDLSPVHDDRPYFFQNTRGLLATARAQPGRLWVLAGALLLAALVIRQRGRALVRPAATASLLGAAFLTFELALIQRFTRVAGGTRSASCGRHAARVARQGCGIALPGYVMFAGPYQVKISGTRRPAAIAGSAFIRSTTCSFVGTSNRKMPAMAVLSAGSASIGPAIRSLPCFAIASMFAMCPSNSFVDAGVLSAVHVGPRRSSTR